MTTEEFRIQSRAFTAKMEAFNEIEAILADWQVVPPEDISFPDSNAQRGVTATLDVVRLQIVEKRKELQKLYQEFGKQVEVLTKQ